MELLHSAHARKHNRKEILMHSIWFGEFMGTLVLVLLGGGVNAGVTLRKSYGADAGWMVVCSGWALAVLCGVLVAQAFGSPGANLNPAITLAAAVIDGDYSQLLTFWSAQLLGAMAGATLMTLHYAPHWKLTHDPAAKLAVFCTNAAVRSPVFNIRSEALGTAVLVLVAGAIFSHGVSVNGPAAGLGRGSWLAWCGASASRWVEPPATPSTPRVIWVRASFIGCCPFPARADRTGAMRRSRSSATLRVRR
jgi:glycerol uptake facilitator-like aquaporin